MKAQNIQEWFYQSAEKFAGQIAIEYADKSITFRELDDESNRLANFLIEEGVAKGSPVAILTDDAAHAITSILGILKAGCVFVPLDPRIPEKRVEAMVGGVAPRWFVGEEKYLEQIDRLARALDLHVEVVCPVAPETPDAGKTYDNLSLHQDFKTYSNSERPAVTSEPDDMCYIYFTSGSTGQPKGIAGRLKGIDHFIAWEIETLELGPGTRVSQLLNFTFDGSLRDIFVALCAGGTICVPENRDTILDARKLVNWIDEQKINVIHCVPSLFRSLVNEAADPGLFAALRYILMAGEPLLPADVNRWMNVFGERVQLVNLYGTSETTMAKFAYFVTAADAARLSIPVGKPIPGARAVLVDEKGKVCPPGIIGEIYIRTPYRSHGYYNQPELTGEVFIQNPFGKDPADIVYKTGDLGRILPDENFEFLGRLDQQVKVRGVRVELAEIDNLLRKHDAIKEVAVVDYEDPGGNKSLCAYVVLQNAIDLGDLRDFVAEHLPDYMVPSIFLLIDKLPRTISGKVDRRALPSPMQSQLEQGDEFTAPQTSVEEVLASIWSRILGIKNIGREQNFFQLGAHSLMATQITSRIRSIFRVELPLQSLFESPTIAGLAQNIEAAMKANLGFSAPPIETSAHDGQPPLSFAQQRLLFIELLDPGTSVYHINSFLRLKGQLNMAALEQAFAEIQRRHEVLRTTFPIVDGPSVQRIDANAPTPLITLVDLRGVADGESLGRRLAGEASVPPFDLINGPLWRTTLFRISEDEHIALLTMHHIISDGWSMSMLINEVSSLYPAFLRGAASPLPPLPIQYADYALWQRRWLDGDVLDRQLSYWRTQLEGAPPVLELPTDKARPPVRSFRGASRTSVLSAELTEGLKEVSRKEGATLFMVLLAGFNALLYRYTGQSDISVGTPIAGRTHTELEGLIGFFINTLVLRTQLDAEMSFRDLIGRVRETSLNAYLHQDVPFEKLIEDLQPARDLSRTPLFQVMLVLQNAPALELRLPDLDLTAMQLDDETAKFDLTLMFSEERGELVATAQYNTDLFEGETVGRMLEHLERVLSGMVRDVEQSVGRVRVLGEREEQQLIGEWNERTGAEETVEDESETTATIQQLFEAQAARAPEATALVFEDTRVTYGELNRRANQLAHHLRGLGVRPDMAVGICVERSIEMVVGLLGILKAGAAYLPLDPAYPAERLAFMLEDAQVRVLLTQEQLLATLPRHSAQTVCLDADWPEIARHSSENPRDEATADNLAYIIYTSGSTGHPKGVLVTHRNVERLLTTNRALLDFDEHDVWTLFHSYAFDFSVWELFGSLLYGARLVIVPFWVSRSTEDFHRLLCEQGVTVLNQTPSAFRQLMRVDESEATRGRAAGETGEGGAQLSLRLVIFGGEALELQSLRPWFARHTDDSPRLVNMYGITETTVHVSYRPLTSADAASASTSSLIGSSLPSVQIYILDGQQQLSPVGVVGEICVAGTGLARGYLNRPELTAERFTPNPFSTEEGARLYRSGDRARYLPDGDIEYLGRNDKQVKVRGFRIELGEIEAALSEHEGVGECVVLADEEGGAGKRLVAYLVRSLDGKPAATPGEWRDYLRPKLPEHMIPAAFIVLEQMPLTANGKIDREALPQLAEGTPQTSTGYVAPRTTTEELVASFWSTLLRVERIGRHDNFFELGGHSLTATQVITRVRTTLNVEIPLRRLFEAPTVAELAQSIDEELRAGHQVQLPPILPRAADAPLQLSFAQQRLWFIDQLQPGTPQYNIPAVMRLTGRLDHNALAQSLNEVVRRHESLRTSFVSHDGEPVQVIRDEWQLQMPVVDLSAFPENEREAEAQRFLSAETQRGFDLSAGPLLRAHLLRLGDREHIALLTMHHIISDGWSMSMLINEVSSLYPAFLRGAASPLSPLPIQYADYALWQRRWLDGDVLDRQLSYWRTQLEGAPPVLELPTDKARPPVRSFRGASRTAVFGKELTEGLKDVSRKEGATLFMVLLAGFNALLHRYTGQSDLSVGTPIANRNYREIENLIGFFINTLVLRTQLDAEMSFRELIGRVRETSLNAYLHQDVPFEKLIEELRPERDLSRTPLFQVMLVLQNAPALELRLPDLDLTAMQLDDETAKFDLTLMFSEERGELVATAQYNTDLFEGETVGRMLEHLERVLSGMVTDVEQSVGRVRVLGEREQRLLIGEGNRRADEREGSGATAQQLFEAVAAERPDAIAIVSGEAQMSYGELNRRANRLARYLSKHGVGLEVPVGLCMDRTPEMVVGLLGILKAGGAYVPLDPTYPRERLAFMIEDARLPVLLTQEWLVEELPSHQARVLCLDALSGEIAKEYDGNPPTPATARNLAYIIYTSGSTGRPKGVMVEHGGLRNLSKAQVRAFDLRPENHILQYASLSFDASIFEIVMALGTGATLHLARTETLLPGAGLIQLMRREAITNITIPPSALAAMPDDELPGLRTIVVAGEACPAELVERWGLNRRFFNAYGPTETTVWATLSECFDSSRKPPIGRPIDNTQVYLLDAQQEIVARGITGELYIGGAGLARGYFNRPDLTAERFIPNPYATEPGALLYRTGDLTRYLPDANLEFLGRADNQMKIRGFRIEAGEVEATLAKHPGVREALVHVLEDETGAKQLVAYTIAATDESPTVSDLRRHLRETLPEFMIPSAFVALDAFPLNPSGKVDRKRLPQPEESRPELESIYVAPGTKTEQAIAAVWQEVLQLDMVGIHDNFFDLGGHSLLLVKAHSRLQEIFEQDISILDLFQYPTIDALATYLTNQHETEYSQSQDEQAEKLQEGRNRLQQQLKLSQQAAAERLGGQHESR
ncbi:MAG TPA: amino acid adenylation domain-containing protein [Pyrinomonadaceae bacterium]